jgi:hypothetical protein
VLCTLASPDDVVTPFDAGIVVLMNLRRWQNGLVAPHARMMGRWVNKECPHEIIEPVRVLSDHVTMPDPSQPGRRQQSGPIVAGRGVCSLAGQARPYDSEAWA